MTAPASRVVATILLMAIGLPALASRSAWAGSASQGSMGGGLIELLMTGRDPTPRVAGQARRSQPGDLAPATADPSQPARVASMPVGNPYRAIEAEPDPRFERQQVAFSGSYAPGTIVIDSDNKFLYLVEAGGTALRYGIGVGRPGFTWAGVKSITRKAEWPDWTPPAEMLKRRPDLPRHMEGGEMNPLGARAMYLGSSLYRIHGTNEPNTIGTNVSSGCIRLRNEDVIDLYGRVTVGTTVVVL
jgi:lipoprotein-anchoring transpeptidase ErfK/SrfK